MTEDREPERKVLAQSRAEPSTSPPTDATTVQLARDDDGEPLGAGVFLGAETLRELGVDLDAGDRLIYWVDGSTVRVVVDRDGGDTA